MTSRHPELAQPHQPTARHHILALLETRWFSEELSAGLLIYRPGSSTGAKQHGNFESQFNKKSLSTFIIVLASMWFYKYSLVPSVGDQWLVTMYDPLSRWLYELSPSVILLIFETDCSVKCGIVSDCRLEIWLTWHLTIYCQFIIG